ncbi:MAG: hypothetical protein KGZ88_18815 [Methylomicrobium sp.]|nr:hypothetical protein [Methylomicrobium sp.]
MQVFLFVLTFLLSNFGYADNFGDQVVACIVEKKLTSTSDNFAICEKLVQDQRDKETANKVVNKVMAEVKAKQEKYDHWQRVMNVTMQSYYCYSSFIETSIKTANYSQFKDCDAAKEFMWDMAYKKCFLEFRNPVSQSYVKNYFKSEKESEAFFIGASWTSQAMVKSEVHKVCH